MSCFKEIEKFTKEQQLVHYLKTFIVKLRTASWKKQYQTAVDSFRCSTVESKNAPWWPVTSLGPTLDLGTGIQRTRRRLGTEHRPLLGLICGLILQHLLSGDSLLGSPIEGACQTRWGFSRALRVLARLAPYRPPEAQASPKLHPRIRCLQEPRSVYIQSECSESLTWRSHLHPHHGCCHRSPDSNSEKSTRFVCKIYKCSVRHLCATDNLNNSAYLHTHTLPRTFKICQHKISLR